MIYALPRVGCLDSSDVQRFALGKLGAEETAEAERHVQHCEGCGAAVAQARLSSEAVTSIDDTASPTVDLRGARPPPLEVGTRVGPFEILERLGEGGMGTVYTAYHPTLDRKVALKLILSDGVNAQERHARLLREAIAMARLSHPNVVTLHDVGTHEDKVFLVMERVDGQTLQAWLAQGPRDWREVRRVFLEAGRGLAAAHAAGLVHRDFKPANVILSADGRARVTDFGLARAQLDDSPAPAHFARTEASAVAMSEPVTQTGQTPGTLPYMAPEQLLGRPADPKADQFAFCVSFWEALYRMRPLLVFPVTGPQVVGVHPPPKTPKVPAWLRRILERGLEVDPGRRFPSMNALLDALEHHLVRRRRRWLAAACAASALLVVGIGVRLWLSRQAQLCSGAPERLTGAWDTGVADQVQRRLLASKLPYAAGAWAGVKQRLDEHVAAWTASFRDACAATRLRGEQSEQVMDLRMQCLDEDLYQVTALTGVLSRADDKVVENAVKAVEALPDPARCADVSVLREAAPPPADPTVRGKVALAEKQLAEARALSAAGKAVEARRALDELLPQVDRLGIPRLGALSYEFLGRLEEAKGASSPLSDAAFQRAFEDAEASHLDETAAECLLSLADAQSRDHPHTEQARVLAGLAHGISQRVQHPTLLTAHWRSLLAKLAWEEGKSDEGLAEAREALRLLDGLGKSLAVAGEETDIGWSLLDKGELTAAHDVLVKAFAVREGTLGPDHPVLLQSLNALAREAFISDRSEEGIAYLRRALALSSRLYGPETPRQCYLQANLANALTGQDTQPEEALNQARLAADLCGRVIAADNPQLPQVQIILGAALRQAGHPREATTEHLRAVAAYERLGPTSQSWRACVAFSELAFDAVSRNDSAEALGNAKRALDCVRATKVEGAARGDAHEALAAATLLSGDDASAAALAARALEFRQASKEGPVAIADDKFLLAQARWRTQPASAKSLAEEARAVFEAHGTTRRLREVQAWQANHRK